MKTALLFSGQGSQAVGMGKDLYEAFSEAREVFEEIDDTLHRKLSQYIFEGPTQELTLTYNTQPAIMAVSMAIAKVINKSAHDILNKDIAFCAGHSLGEYSAITFAGGFTLPQCASLLDLRGRGMFEACPEGHGAMAALLGGEIIKAKELCLAASQNQELCVVANDNAASQQVISGHKASVEKALELAKGFGFRKGVKLPVSGPFHSPLMEPAQKQMQDRLAQESIMPLRHPIIPNVLARATTDIQTIKETLGLQITSLVRWRETMSYMESQGVLRVIEVGPGNVLQNLAKRSMSPSVECIAINNVTSLDDFLSSL